MHLKTKLLNHQKKAISKLNGLRVGALFMEMGTGKTRCALELIKNRLKKIDRVFYFCPCSVRQTIVNEIEKHSDGLEYTIVKDGKDKRLSKVVIIGLESISSSDQIYLWINSVITKDSFIIVDESILIKNPKAKRTHRIISMTNGCKYKLIMCGTPMSQGLQDLWSQMQFLSGLILKYKSFRIFARYHLKYSFKFPGMIEGYYNEDLVAKRINPYVYQVTKEECLDLPKKQYYTEFFSMSYKQRALYTKLKDDMLMEIDWDDFTSYTLFKLFLFLQQITCGIQPKGYDGYSIENERIDLLKSVLERVLYPVVIFCKFRQDIEFISEIVPLGCFYHGGLNAAEKNESIERFIKNEKGVLVATQQSGSYGLNLQSTNTVIFYNNQFSYEIRRQAEDRCHRIGMNQVGGNYIDLVCEDSIDGRIQSCLNKKENVIKFFKNELDKVKNKKEKAKRIKELI